MADETALREQLEYTAEAYHESQEQTYSHNGNRGATFRDCGNVTCSKNARLLDGKPTGSPRDYVVKDVGIIMVRVENVDDEEQAISIAEEWFAEQRIREMLENAVDRSDFIIAFSGEWEAEQD